MVLEPARDGGAVLAVSLISTGNGHTCAITTTGALYCWGNNDHGQLGIGSTENSPLPVRVGPESDWKAVATGNASTLALKINGEMWAFGDNDCGQLGLGDFSPQTRPKQIPHGADWTAITLRFQHACALKSDRSLWCWGMNQEGQLGLNDQYVDTNPKKCDATTNRVFDPQQVNALRDVTAVDAGDGHTCAIKTDGTLWCWGRNTEYELGQETPVQVRSPIPVEKDLMDWTMIQSGQSTTCGVRGRGVAYCWGESNGMDGRTGMGIPGVSIDAKTATPMPIGGPPAVVKLSFNTFGGAVIDDKGGLWVWGSNEDGQLGLGSTDTDPSGVAPAPGTGWTQVSVGRFTTCGIVGDSPVCTGNNDDGQLGWGDTTSSPNFRVVKPPRP